MSLRGETKNSTPKLRRFALWLVFASGTGVFILWLIARRRRAFYHIPYPHHVKNVQHLDGGSSKAMLERGFRGLRGLRVADSPSRKGAWDYSSMRELLRHEQLPAMLVDLEAFDHNIKSMGAVAAAHGKKIRLATKSIRVPELIERAMSVGGSTYRGLMCYSVEEALFLAQMSGLADVQEFLIAYPVVQERELEQAWRLAMKHKKKVCLMVDCIEHVQLLDQFWRTKLEDDGRTQSGYTENDKEEESDAEDGSVDNEASDAPRQKLRERSDEDEETVEVKDVDMRLAVCIDVDVSYQAMGGRLHLGVHRSPIRTTEAFRSVAEAILSTRHLRLAGIMTYEAHVAGLPDCNPNESRAMQFIAQKLKRISVPDISRRRSEISECLADLGITLDFFNGGGTGSLRSSARDETLTELTVGSGALQSNLFDYYEENRNTCGFCFALRITRVPEPYVVCCQSGGFIASGSTSLDKSPTVFLPVGLSSFTNEGFGEVQTPFKVPKQVWDDEELRPKVGDPVLMRPAKAGEIAERFDEYLVVDLKNNNIVKRVKTYRGMGLTFY